MDPADSVYAALDGTTRQIRHLRLLPGVEPSEVECELLVTPLDPCEPFEALSYVWGNASDTFPIILAGAPKRVTENLYKALHQLRCADKPRLLWVDALCINQSSIPERNQQVKLMRDIYRRADRVVVWFGPEDPRGTDKEAIDVIMLLGSDHTIHWTDSRVEDGILAVWARILLNPWWHRVWTVQEAVVAKKLVYLCGSLEIDGAVMDGMADSFMMHTSSADRAICCKLDGLQKRIFIAFENPLGDMVTELVNIRRLSGLGDGRKPFPEVFTIFGTREATNLRDKVFGFLGISAGVDNELVDYSLSIEAVFEKTARQHISSTGNLDVLCYSVMEGKKWISIQREGLKLPSWVPDWSLRGAGASTMYRLSNYKTPFLGR
jgi:hypothetical protein